MFADTDRDIFRGGVPQPADWLRAWRACRTPCSFYAAEAHGITENFINGSRVHGARRKAFAAMVKVMGLAIRKRKLEALKAADHVSIGLDDRGGFRLLRFRCDSPSGAVVSGCLGVMRRGGAFSEKQLEDMDDDYSRAMSKSVVRAIQRIATDPLLSTVDAVLVDLICKKVCIGVADGASSAQKCLRFLACGPMPNLLWCARDRAHAVRIATSTPLVNEITFKAWWQDIYGANQHALVPDIQNSEEWTTKLILCQKLVLECSGVQGGGMTKVVQLLRFAKQRFDSMAVPQRLCDCWMLEP